MQKEPWTYEWLKDFGYGDVLYDIGANVGTYSLMAGARGAFVYAFEPLPVNYAELHANVALNGLSETIYCYPIAVSNSDGWIPLRAHMLDTPGYGLASAEKDYAGETLVYVPSEALDSLSAAVFRPPTHIKIDIEGHEYVALTGAMSYFNAGTVKSLIVEIADDQTESKIDLLLNPVGYYGEEAEGSRRTGENRTLIYEQES